MRHAESDEDMVRYINGSILIKLAVFILGASEKVIRHSPDLFRMLRHPPVSPHVSDFYA